MCVYVCWAPGGGGSGVIRGYTIGLKKIVQFLTRRLSRKTGLTGGTKKAGRKLVLMRTASLQRSKYGGQQWTLPAKNNAYMTEKIASPWWHLNFWGELHIHKHTHTHYKTKTDTSATQQQRLNRPRE